MSTGISIKSAYSLITGPLSPIFIKDIRQIFGNTVDHDTQNQYNSSQSAERYYDNLYKHEGLQSSNVKSKKQKTDDLALNEDEKKTYFDGQRFSSVFYDDQSSNLVNFIFSFVKNGLLDPLLKNLYINNSKLIIIAASASNLAQLEDCISLYKRINSDFGYSNLHNKAISQILESNQKDQFEKEMKLAFVQDLKFSKNDDQKCVKCLLVIYSSAGSSAEPKYKKILKSLVTDKINFAEIDSDSSKPCYLNVLMDIIDANFDISNPEAYKKAIKTQLLRI
jgi:hypothetical protein